MKINRFDPEHPLWSALGDQLVRTNMRRWVLDEAGRPTGNLLFLGAIEDGGVVGNLTLEEREILMPATEGSGGIDRPVEDAEGESLRETFVMTFAVDEAYRRRGIGRALQEAALVWTRERGGVQMRSWSSLDKPKNHALKLSMGFAMHPAVHDAAGGFQVSGVYFVKRVDGDPEPRAQGRR